MTGSEPLAPIEPQPDQRLGRYVESVAGGETVRAFVPPPLPPVPAIDVLGLLDRLSHADRALGRLDGITLLGGMPPEVDIVSRFSGAVVAGAAQPAAGLALLDFMASPVNDGLKRQHGMRAVSPAH